MQVTIYEPLGEPAYRQNRTLHNSGAKDMSGMTQSYSEDMLETFVTRSSVRVGKGRTDGRPIVDVHHFRASGPLPDELALQVLWVLI